MATTIKVGHASISENSSANGVGGDQTGREVRIDKSYSITGAFKPNIVLRPKSKALAINSAIACEAGCNNENIGYSQINYGGRNSAEKEARKVDYDLSKIDAACNTDCSAFMTLCAVAGGASFDYYNSWGNAPVCSSMRKWFTQNGDYEVLTDAKHLTITDYLKRGDILVDEDSHTVMVLENGCMILESSCLKVRLSVTSIKATEVSAEMSILKIEDGEEKTPTDEEINLYKWSYCAEPLSTAGDSIFSKDLTEINSGVADFSLTGLKSNKSYILKVTAKELTGEAEVKSANIIFTTLPKYPTEVKNLRVKLDVIADLNTGCSVSFNEPDSWGTAGYANGYRVYLIINGKSVGCNDTIIKPSNTKVIKNILLKDIIKKEKVILNYGDVIQIGIQPWLEDTSGNIIFDASTLRCSSPAYHKHFLSVIDKMFLKIKDSFKRVILYNRGK